jgi:NAD-dependent deacetylase
MTPIVVLTGAGISAESGLRTFRGPDGLWAAHDIGRLATPEAFAADPALVHAFYNERRRKLLSGDVGPNPAHQALARLEEALPGQVTLVTQNIDDLHERAGSRAPIHMHGELLKARCVVTGLVEDCREDLDASSACRCCGRAGRLRPHVVWFGETPLEMEAIHAALSRCRVFLSIGTSGGVYPAAGFVSVARQAGARTVELNLETTEVSGRFDEQVLGPAGAIVPAYVERLLAGRRGPQGR